MYAEGRYRQSRAGFVYKAVGCNELPLLFARLGCICCSRGEEAHVRRAGTWLVKKIVKKIVKSARTEGKDRKDSKAEYFVIACNACCKAPVHVGMRRCYEHSVLWM